MTLFKDKRLAIDSMILIYLLDEHPIYSQKIITILDEAKQIIISTLIYGEILAGFYKKQDTQSIEAVFSFVATRPNIIIKAFDTNTAITFAKLRASYPTISPPDCIHLASAIDSQADLFLSNDKKLKKITELPIYILND